MTAPHSILVSVIGIIAATGCRTVYRDPLTGYSVQHSQRYHRGVGLTAMGILPIEGDRGELGMVNPAVLEYVFAAPEGPFARYYDLMLSLPDPTEAVKLDVYALDTEARRGLASGVAPSGRDYARALGRKLAGPINRALLMTASRFEGSVGVYWGIPVDLDRGLVLAPYERDDQDTMMTTILRYQSAELIVMHSSALEVALMWDVSQIPAAFDSSVALDQAAVAESIIALHPGREL